MIFFTEESIKMRDPVLYYLYVGKFKRHGEEAGKEIALSTMLLDQLQNAEWEKALVHALKTSKYVLDMDASEKEEIAPEELEDNEDELILLMHERFLAGLETKHINYKDIDENSDLDDTKIINQDAEDGYFDEEEGTTNEKSSSSFTGELDY